MRDGVVLWCWAVVVCGDGVGFVVWCCCGEGCLVFCGGVDVCGVVAWWCVVVMWCYVVCVVMFCDGVLC